MHQNRGYFKGLTKLETLLPAGALMLSVLFLVFSSMELSSSIMNGLFDEVHSKGSWFQRSGSVTVLISAVIEFRIFSRIHLQDKGTPSTKTKAGFLTVDEVCYLNILQKVSLTLVVVSTFIWGYGDLLF